MTAIIFSVAANAPKPKLKKPKLSVATHNTLTTSNPDVGCTVKLGFSLEVFVARSEGHSVVSLPGAIAMADRDKGTRRRNFDQRSGSNHLATNRLNNSGDGTEIILADASHSPTSTNALR